MTVNELIKKYQALGVNRKRGINLYSLTRHELIKLIQSTEGNSPCFKSNISHSCGQTDCCWYGECKK